MRRLHTDYRRSRQPPHDCPPFWPPDLTSRQKPSPLVLLVAFEIILRTTATLPVAERLRRAGDRFDSPRMFGSHRDLQPTPSAPRPVLVRRLLPTHPHASLARQRLPPIPPDSAWQHRKSRSHPKSRWLASSLRTSRRLTRLGLLLTNRRAAAVHRRLRIYLSVGFSISIRVQPLVIRIKAGIL